MEVVRKLPIGIQSFEKLRKSSYLYVDKTQYIHDLIQSGGTYFLSRPRRFGKSLLVSTMEAYFQGKKELFEGLAIEHLENERGNEAWTSYPVIKFSLSGGDYHAPDGLAEVLDRKLDSYERKYGIEKANYDLPNRFGYLIEQLYRKTGRNVVVLVDEYDKPLLETISDPKQEERNRQLYKGFFSILKDEDQYLQFVFFTGVTKFSKISVFSDLNQLKDISLSDEFSGICGITEEEMEKTFSPEIDRLAARMNISHSKCIKKLADMYDGYCFSPEGVDVYNPFSLLNAFQDQRLRRYWYETGTPTFLVKKLMASDFTPERLTGGVEIDEQSLMNYRADDTDPIPLFYQTGYLTICGYDDEFQIYSLQFPNQEVKYGFLNSLVPYVLGKNDAENPAILRSMVQDLRNGNLTFFLRRMESLFASIPYIEGKALDYEQIWRNQMFLILTLLGQNVTCEVHSALGRADCVIQTNEYIYVMEFKIDRSASEALEQIRKNEYAKQYLMKPQQVITAGVRFSSKKKNIVEWVIGNACGQPKQKCCQEEYS